MSRVICVMGESGSGKTTSCRTLDPTSTYYIDADKKGLSWKGWRKQYNAERKNYVSTDDPALVQIVLRGVSDTRPEIKTIVVDTLNGIMVGDEMRRVKEKGYDKWVDIASFVWNIVDGAYGYRDDLTIVFLCHTQTERDDNGYAWTRIKTNGRKLDKIVLESKFTTVLLAKVVKGKYVFETQSNNSTAKTPLGAFDAPEIDNDISKVIKALEEF